ncbi:TetR/AcrR family transcriptional regulator [Nocardiopsis sp. NPDC101807]|uniref:TetR/AcrR family transcriptional regulator n=1 Tax=Nocardiopsis sp. NPDC101807 TaxID=3364339 RepID=UPI00380A6059
MTAPSDARARGTRLPRVRRRRQLLSAAQEVFVARGYHAAAMDEIADRAGVSKPVLYQHFPGKLELYLALLEEHSEALVEKQREALESTDDNRQRVAASFQAYFDFVAGDGEAFRLVFESDLRNLPAVREKTEQTFQRCAELIGAVIRQDTSISDEEAHLLSIGLVGMAETSARYWLNNHGAVPKDAAEQLVARLAWRGISGWDLQRRADEQDAQA